MTAISTISTASKDEIYNWIVDTMHDMFEIDKASINMQSNLYTDLDIDSIDAVDLAVKVKEFTGKRLQPEIFKTVRTVEDVVNALVDLMAE
jgi:acyl carrier protein